MMRYHKKLEIFSTLKPTNKIKAKKEQHYRRWAK